MFYTSDIPYFQAHGESDNILPLSHGIQTSKILKQFLPNHQVAEFSNFIHFNKFNH